MTTAIRRPGVEIAQEFITSSPTVSAPTLVPCIVGPCFRVISAFDDDGDPQSDAYAGTYQDGYGTVSYSLPSLGDEDDLSTLTGDIRVFLVLGSASTELNSESDEEVLASGTGTGEYDQSAGTFTDLSATFLQLGVESGDVVRVTWRDREVDIPISADATSDTVLTVSDALVDEDLSTADYEIIRNPAQFVFDASAQASVLIGDEDDYLQFSATALKLDAVTVADYAGSAGDDLSVEIVETEEISSGTSSGYIGDSVFDSASATFVTDLGGTGAPSVDHYVSQGALGIGQALRQVLYVVSETRALIETGEGTLSSQDWIVGSEVDTGTAGVYDHTGGAHEKVFTDASATFLTDIPTTGGAGTAPTTTTHIEIEGNGIYEIATVESETEVTLDVTVNPGGDVASSSWTVVEEVGGGSSDGNTAADTVLVDPTATFVTDGVTSSYSVDVDGDAVYAVSSVTSETELVIASATDAAQVTYEIVDTTSALAITWDEEAEEVTITLARVAGVSTSTYAAVEDAITDDGNASYNAAVAEFLTAALGGDTGTGLVTLTESDVGSYQLDGGADDEQLILDADLIGSATPIGKIYVSYKALRVDVSAGAAEPELLQYDSSTEMQAALGDATTDNPLALGMYFAFLNATSKVVSGIGIDEVSATKPDGTLEAYQTALEFLEGQEVYSLAPLTQDPTVHAVFQTHVDSMSESENKSERVLFFSQAFPSYATAETLASGTSGNTTTFDGEAVAEFSTSVDLVAAGVQEAIDAGDDVYLVVSSLSSSDESPEAVNGTQGLYGIQVDAVKTGDNFVLELDASVTGIDSSWDDLVDVTWTVYSAGSAITSKSAQSAAVAEIGENFADRRVFHVWPPTVTGDVDGSSTNLEGFYLASAVAGLVAQKSPGQGFTNTTVAGFTGLKYSNNYFSEGQLEIIAGGGTMVYEQHSSGGALKCRHQLSTDVSTVQKRELSITKSVDFVAKFLRGALTAQIGKFNITQSFMDSLSVMVQGLGRYLVDAKVLKGFSVSSISIDPDNQDQVNIVCALDVMYPCNVIYMTLQV